MSAEEESVQESSVSGCVCVCVYERDVCVKCVLMLYFIAMLLS